MTKKTLNTHINWMEFLAMHNKISKDTSMILNLADQHYLSECRTALATVQAKSLAETNNWSHVDKAQVHSDWDFLYKQLVSIIDTLDPASDKAQSFIARHCEIASRFYPPQKNDYIGLALLYEENAEMKAYHNAYHPNMVAFLGSAIFTYATTNL
jgi:hypothetical protein